MVSRDELADALWPDVLPDTWAAALRGVVTEVRRFLEDGGLDPAEVLAAARGGYQLRLPPGVVVDLDEARAALAAAREQLAGGGTGARRPSTRSAPRRWRGCRSCRSHEGEWVDGVRGELGDDARAGAGAAGAGARAGG